MTSVISSISACTSAGNWRKTVHYYHHRHRNTKHIHTPTRRSEDTSTTRFTDTAFTNATQHMGTNRGGSGVVAVHEHTSNANNRWCVQCVPQHAPLRHPLPRPRIPPRNQNLRPMNCRTPVRLAERLPARHLACTTKQRNHNTGIERVRRTLESPTLSLTKLRVSDAQHSTTTHPSHPSHPHYALGTGKPTLASMRWCVPGLSTSNVSISSAISAVKPTLRGRPVAEAYHTNMYVPWYVCEGIDKFNNDERVSVGRLVGRLVGHCVVVQFCSTKRRTGPNGPATIQPSNHHINRPTDQPNNQPTNTPQILPRCCGSPTNSAAGTWRASSRHACRAQRSH